MFQAMKYPWFASSLRGLDEIVESSAHARTVYALGVDQGLCISERAPL
jgi:hypothetical protein